VKWLGPVDLALQQAAWWSAVPLAAAGGPLAGAAAALAPVAVHLLLRPMERARLGRAAGAAAAFGLATDGALAAAGLASFAGGGPIAPWMVALWGTFGAGLTASMRRVATWPPLVLAALGAAAGPLAYRAGAGLGAIELAGAGALLAIALQWAVGLPLLSRVARASRGRAPDAGGADAAAAGAEP
jgi:hypothetical protein